MSSSLSTPDDVTKNSTLSPFILVNAGKFRASVIGVKAPLVPVTLHPLTPSTSAPDKDPVLTEILVILPGAAATEADKSASKFTSA